MNATPSGLILHVRATSPRPLAVVQRPVSTASRNRPSRRVLDSTASPPRKMPFPPPHGGRLWRRDDGRMGVGNHDGPELNHGAGFQGRRRATAGRPTGHRALRRTKNPAHLVCMTGQTPGESFAPNRGGYTFNGGDSFLDEIWFDRWGTRHENPAERRKSGAPCGIHFQHVGRDVPRGTASTRCRGGPSIRRHRAPRDARSRILVSRCRTRASAHRYVEGGGAPGGAAVVTARTVRSTRLKAAGGAMTGCLRGRAVGGWRRRTAPAQAGLALSTELEKLLPGPGRGTGAGSALDP